MSVDRRGRPRVVTEFNDESLTVQSDYELTKIDKIMARYGVTGVLEMLDNVDDVFLDVTELPEDYQSVLEYTKAAESEFLKLPSKVREMFDHDVAKWLDAAHDQEKRDAIAARLAEQSGSEPPPGGGASASSAGTGQSGSNADSGGDSAPAAETS